MELGHICDVDIIQICTAIFAPGKLWTRRTLLPPSPALPRLCREGGSAGTDTPNRHDFDFDWALTLTLQKKYCDKYRIQPKYIEIWLLVHIAQPYAWLHF